MNVSEIPSHALRAVNKNMSDEMLTPDQSPRDAHSPSNHQHAAKPQRTLACVLCQQRKVKCDRKFPCANCTKAGSQCMPAALVPRQRRRRFPERDLLNRLRHYEDLLRRHKIPFESMHPNEPTATAPGERSKLDEQAATPQDDQAASRSPIVAEVDGGDNTTYLAKNFWHAMNRKSQSLENDDLYAEAATADENDDGSDASGYMLREKVVKSAWDSLYDRSDHLLFYSPSPSIDLSTLHPNQMHIFKIWQLYLENVDPLLKVTHGPTLQGRIIDAASDLANIEAPLEALMFSIYCASIFSLDQDECQKYFGSSRQSLLSNYQLGAREALLRSRFLRTDNLDCLTALHFYLMTIKPETDPRALSGLLGTAIRIAQRMGIHDESSNRKKPALEAELRRRLWWSLVLFDARISEMTDFRLGLLLPSWDCRPPLNVNDSEFRPEMRMSPNSHGLSSEAVFAVVRGVFGDFVRHCSFHLDFINPALKPIIRKQFSQLDLESDELSKLEKLMEETYLQHLDPQNPLHFMTIWWARGQLAKSRFMKHLSECSSDPVQATDDRRNVGISYALAMLECDTRIMSSKRNKGFRWLIYLNFPFPAYVHIVQDLRRRPQSENASSAWQIMSENCAVRFKDIDVRYRFMDNKENPFFKIFADVVFQAWNAREAAMANVEPSQKDPVPSIVTQIQARMAKIAAESAQVEDMQEGTGNGLNLGQHDILSGVDMAATYGTGQHLMGTENELFPAFQDQSWMGLSAQAWGWPQADVHPILGHGW